MNIFFGRLLCAVDSFNQVNCDDDWAVVVMVICGVLASASSSSVITSVEEEL